MTKQILAMALAATIAAVPILAQQAPPSVTLGGKAKKEAKKPYTDYTTRARNVQTGEIAGTATNAIPTPTSTSPVSLRRTTCVELLNKDGKSRLHRGSVRHDAAVREERHRHQLQQGAGGLVAAWRGGAAGITAGIVVGTQSSAQ
jgi:hypothetical protein